jgi:hypothetical protein
VNCVEYLQIAAGIGIFIFLVLYLVDVLLIAAVLSSGQALLGVKALGEAVNKLRPSPESLTSVHGDFLQLSLVAKIFKV